MSRFSCRCGNVISDTVYPSPEFGELKWQTETEARSQQRSQDVKDFLAALENGQDKDWVRNYFNEEYAESYPDRITRAAVIEDITSRADNAAGRAVVRCEMCERLYIQKEFYTDEWACFEQVE
jgi:hypothetical protein